MKNTPWIVLLILFSLTGLGFAAENEEIDYLLNFITDSHCTFIRNGKEYPAQEASEHLQYKYSHVKSRIKTADDFVSKIASKSSISKKPYEVECGEKRMKTAQWLAEALRSHRERARKE